MAGFEADAPLPPSSRIRITVTSGLGDLGGGSQLGADYAWTFTTPAIALSDLTGANTRDADLQPVDLRPRVSFTSNVELDANSLAEHATLVPQSGGGAPVALAPVPSATNSPGASDTGPSGGDNGIGYELAPQAELAAGTRYAISIAPGIMPGAAICPSLSSYTGKLQTRGPLTSFPGHDLCARWRWWHRSRFVDGEVGLTFKPDQERANRNYPFAVAEFQSFGTATDSLRSCASIRSRLRR